MVDLKIIEKFLSAILPDEAKIPSHNLFSSIQRDRMSSLMGGLMYVPNHWLSENKQERAAVVNGVLFGICLAYCSEDENMRDYFEGYLEQVRKHKGGNVVDFLQRKAGIHGNA